MQKEKVFLEEESIEVSRDGTMIFKRKDGQTRKLNRVLSRIPYKNKVREYHIVSPYDSDKKQRVYYVGRLMAKAFLENPQKASQIVYVDGNTLNNDLDNIRWETKEDRASRLAVTHRKTREKRERHRETCKNCGEEFDTRKNTRCPECAVSNAIYMKKITPYLGIDMSTLKDHHLLSLRMYLQYGNQSTAAKALNITRQTISLHLIAILKGETRND